MPKLYQTSAWKKARKAFIEGKSCGWNPEHEGPLVVDHLTYMNPDGSSMTDAQLLDFEKSHSEGRLLVLCRKCAYARRYNKVLCEVCGENYHGKRRKMCFGCHMKKNPEDYQLCPECGVNYHDKRYPRCALCTKKLKRSRAGRKGWDTRRNQGRKT